MGVSTPDRIGQAGNRCTWRLLRILLACRYRVRIDRADELAAALARVQGPLLVLPNHPAYVDPALLLAFLPYRRVLRPIVYTDTFRHRLLQPWMRVWRALEVPELSRDRRVARDQMRTVLEQASVGLIRGEQFLLYPSGRLQRNHLEAIGAARSAHALLQQVPHTQVLLVRSRGVWGSMFSCASTGDVPPLSQTMRRGLGWMLLSLFVFLPRRQVRLTCELVDARSLLHLNRADLNRWLETWYNLDGGEMPTQVPYHRWSRPIRRPLAGLVKLTEQFDARQIDTAPPVETCNLTTAQE